MLAGEKVVNALLDVGDLHVFGPPGSRSGSISQRYGSESGSGSSSNKYEKNIFFASLKSMKKEVRSISQRYGSGDPDPDLHQNVTDPQHCF
jgi:hypothetical protein